MGTERVKLQLPDSELRKLSEMLKGASKKINEAANEGLYKVGLQTAADAQRNLKENGSYASGKLVKSIIVKPQKDFTIDVIANADYAYWVEHGRKSGTPPPYKPILEWIKKKGLQDTYNIKTRKQTSRGSATNKIGKTGKLIKQSDFYKRAIGMAIAIAKSIGEQGTKAKPFLFPAMRENEKEMMRVINEAIKKVL